jgi:uncharacterized membrane protein YdfJ with MMPL/SSD domain
LGVVPPALAVLLDFAAMGWLGVPLGVATAMFAALAMGIGIDSAIQLLERTERLRAAGHPEPLVEALAVTGPAMAIDTLSVALGFAVLLLSNVPATARLGGLIALALLTCLTATLTVVPALLASRRQPPPWQLLRQDAGDDQRRGIDGGAADQPGKPGMPWSPPSGEPAAARAGSRAATFCCASWR